MSFSTCVWVCPGPAFAWDRGGEWRDSSHYPDRVWFDRVTAVPGRDARCGETVPNLAAHLRGFDGFRESVTGGAFVPRDPVLENLTGEKGGQRDLDIVPRATAPGSVPVMVTPG